MKRKLTNRLPALAFPAVMMAGLSLIPVSTTCAADKPQNESARPVAVLPPATMAAPPLAPLPAAYDATTGLPLASSQPWKDPKWPDPERTIPEVFYDALPLSEIAEQLRREFRDAFDVLIPSRWEDPSHPSRNINPQDFTVRMRLKGVRASEVFNAMNLMFEAENTPCRWELKMNGNRPLAMLRLLPERIPTIALPPPQAVTRMVYFVGDMLGEGSEGDGPTIEQLFNTVSEVYQLSYGQPKGVLQFHKKAQLLVVTGTGDQIRFVQQTLSALREKPRAERRVSPSGAELKPR